MSLLLLYACASSEPGWAFQHASVIPSETGLSGTQTWEFFTRAWADDRDADTFVCARAQDVDGVVASPLKGCDGCIAAYELSTTELDTGCDDPLASDEAYGADALAVAVGDVPDELAELDPYPGRTLGWYVSFDGEKLSPYGFAYAEALDWQGQTGAAGWTTGQTYTLWPAYAWEIP